MAHHAAARPALDQSCYVEGCAAHADFRCTRCGQPCCAAHVRHVPLQRRAAPDETAPDGLELTHLPSQIRVYTFCLRCKQ